ncbi:hypothetical protein C8R44DRAFT_744888 [Mycena epipterygia]|nr:hypothetical protein C8R44DRAFT_744888 [Mycena epipterygia]
MDSATRARLQKLVSSQQSGEGRPLSELLKTKEILKGAESQRLRTFFTSNCMEPGRDLDDYGVLLTTGSVDQVRADFQRRVARHTDIATPAGGSTDTADAPADPATAAAREIYALVWGPTRVPVYQLLGLLRLIYPANARAHLEMARFFITEAKVSVDAPDLSGTQALSQAFSTKPAQDFEYAQLLYDAGGDVNNRNRYGGTVAHEIAQIWTPQDKSVVAKAAKSFEWFLAHGGNVDIADSDGMAVRHMVSRLSRFAPELVRLLDAADKTRKACAKTADGCCALCGRAGEGAVPALLKYGKCKAVRYCPPSVRGCQKLDWPHHKKSCVKVVGAEEGFSFLGTKFKPAWSVAV